MTDEIQTTEVAKSEPTFVPPSLIDDELKRLLAERGVLETKRSEKYVIAFFVMCGLVGLISGFFGFDLPMFEISLAIVSVFAVSWIVGSMQTHKLVKAFENRQYALVSKLAPSALLVNSWWIPITYFQMAQCSQIFFRLLSIEGRHLELEAVTRFAWAVHERRAVTTGLPKDQMIANNLAVAILNQWRFEEASEIFKQVLQKTKNKVVLPYILNNSAFCMVRMKRYDEAESYLQQALGDKPPKNDLIGRRLQLNRAFIAVGKGDLEYAERDLRDVQEKALKAKEPIEFQVDCESLLGDIRRKQERLEEADLHYRNAVDILESGPNPSYFALAWTLKEHAEILEEMRQPDQAKERLLRAEQYYQILWQREEAAIASIKQRLRDPKPMWVVTAITENTDRTRLIQD